jgi:hypothetical protein
MLTRQHFEAFARIAANVNDHTDRAQVTEDFIRLGEASNPRFNRDRFRLAVAELYIARVEERLDQWAAE